MSANLFKQLREEEGEVLHAYKDSEGYLTIGVGRLIDQRKGGGLSKEEAQYLLNNDVERFTKATLKALPWVANLDEARQGVFIGMAFQMGINGVLDFKNMLAKCKAKDYSGAATEMTNSLWAKQTPWRAARLAEQMRTGKWQFK